MLFVYLRSTSTVLPPPPPHPPAQQSSKRNINLTTKAAPVSRVVITIKQELRVTPERARISLLFHKTTENLDLVVADEIKRSKENPQRERGMKVG